MPDRADVFSQAGARVRFGWEVRGALEVAADPARTLVVVVDVLSFSTTVSMATSRGIAVFPFRGSDVDAQRFAAENDAVVAGARRSESRVSLSPSSFQHAVGIERVVLRSRNGATISSALAEAGCRVVAGCLRNASAVAAFCSEFLATDPRHVVVVLAAGERWEDDRTLRPAVEDLWGAGAIAAGIPAALSTEARVAVAAFESARPRLLDGLRDCSSGRELVGLGFANDVTLAAEFDVSDAVPRLVEGAFRT